MSAREWCILTHYNGAGGCPTNYFNGVSTYMPIEFKGGTVPWVYHHNSQTYVPAVMRDRNLPEVE